MCVSSWTRLAPNTLPAMAKSGANYMNSQLIKMEAIINGYVEGIALDNHGYVSEGSGENVFVVRNGILADFAARQFRVAGHYAGFGAADRSRAGNSGGRAGHSARDAVHRRGSLLHRDRGRSHSHPVGGQGSAWATEGWADDARRSRKEFFAIIRGEKPDRFNWLTPVAVGSKQPVSV